MRRSGSSSLFVLFGSAALAAVGTLASGVLDLSAAGDATAAGAGISAESRPTTTASATAGAEAAIAQKNPAAAFAPDSLLALATFDTAWTRIRDSYYDAEMGGVDWEGARAELRPRAGAAADTEELRGVIRELLSRLGESHFVIIPAETPSPSDLEASTGDPGGEGDPGIELRWIDGRALVTRVAPGSRAAAAGMHPGFLVTAIGGREVSGLLEGLINEAGEPVPDLPLTLAWIHGMLRGALAGARDTPLALLVMDEAGTERTVEFPRGAPAGEVVRFGNLPPLRLEVEAEAVSAAGGRAAGVIRFTGWFPSAAPAIAEAVDRFRGMDGMILDLRGNPGGIGGMVMGVGGHFLDERIDLGTMRTRDAEVRFLANPQRVAPDGRRVAPYDGPLAILIDPRTGSTSEIFAAGMQAIERARLFGERSAGQALPALVTRLPNGDRLMHVVADFVAPDGMRIEGRGVAPDEYVVPDRATLLSGADPVLERALAWIAGVASQPSETLR